MSKKSRPSTVVLDSEALSALAAKDREFLVMYDELDQMGVAFVVSATTIMEGAHPKLDEARLRWSLSQLKVAPVTKEPAITASRMLRKAGLHGHTHALDAAVAELADRQDAPVVVWTSDPDDMKRLCNDAVRVLRV